MKAVSRYKGRGALYSEFLCQTCLFQDSYRVWLSGHNPPRLAKMAPFPQIPYVWELVPLGSNLTTGAQCSSQLSVSWSSEPFHESQGCPAARLGPPPPLPQRFKALSGRAVGSVAQWGPRATQAGCLALCWHIGSCRSLVKAPRETPLF